MEYARRRARVFSSSPRTLVYVPSLGLGYGLEELLERLPAGSAVLCVEAYQPLMALAMQQGLPRDPRLFILRSDDAESVARMLREIGVWRFRRVAEVPLCMGYRLAPALYAGMRRSLENQLREYWRNRITLIALGSLQVRNLLANIPVLARAGDLASVTTSKPAIIAGAGPSLDDLLPALRAVRKKVVLVAVDTALPRLAAESLQPDVVVSLDAQLANLRDFLPAPAPGILLAAELSSHPSIPRLFEDRVLFFSSAFAPLALFARMAKAGILPCPMPALGSVGVAAVRAALQLTRAEIFLAGLDFSYSRHLTHAPGTAHHLAALSGSSRVNGAESAFFKAIADRPRRLVADKWGRPVVTDAVLASYRASLQRVITNAAGRVFDAGATGLDLAAPRVTNRELEEKIGAAVRDGDDGGRCLEAGRAFVTTSERVRAFLRGELEILRRGDELLRRALASSAPSAECVAFLEEADYVWVHFPDQPHDSAPDRSFLARAAVAVRYYAERLTRLESLL